MGTNIVGSLGIEIATNVARIKADMAEAKSAIGTAMKDVESYVGTAKTALLGLGGALSIKSFAGVIEGAIEAKVKLYEMSVQTGISVEALSGLGKIAKYSNTDLTDIAGASNKLSKALFTQNEDSKGAAQALKALGINFAEFKALGADEQFVAVAKAMGEFEDGTQKSAAAMLLYGKSGATLLPFLKELEERGYAVGKQTTESALQAKKYEDNIITLTAAASAWKRELAEAALPTLITVTGAMVDARKEADKFNLVGEALKITLQTLAVVGANVSFVFQGVGREIGAIAAQAAAVAQGNFAGAAAIRDAVIADGKQARADLDATELKLMGLKSKISTAGDFQRTDKDTSPVARKRLGLDDALPGTSTVKDDYTPLMKSIQEKIALDQAELASIIKLTEGQKLQAKVASDLSGGYIKLTADQTLAVDGALKQVLALEKLNQAKQAAQEMDLQQHVALQDEFLRVKAAQEGLKLMQQQADEYGLTTDQLKALTSARLRDAAAQLELKAQFNGNTEFLEAQSKLYRDQAQALRDLAAAHDQLAAKEAADRNDPLNGANRAVKDYLADVQRAGDATYGAVSNSMKGLEDLTVTALSGGDAKNAAKAWVSSIISEIERLYVVKPMLAAIFGGGSSGGSGWLGALGSIASAYLGGSSGLSTADYGSSGFATGTNPNYGNEGGFHMSTGTNYVPYDGMKATLHEGEAVVPKAYNPSAGGAGGSSRPVSVQITNNGQPVQARSTQRETSEGTVIEMVLSAVAADMASGGKVHDATQRRFGLNPGGTTPRY